MSGRSSQGPRRAALAATLMGLTMVMGAPAFAGPTPAPPTLATPIRLVAAGSLRGALQRIIALWETDHGDAPVALEVGPAGWLRDQIIAGRPFDLFVPAATSHAEAVHQAGLGGSPVLLLHNRLCAMVRADRNVDAATIVNFVLAPATRIGTSAPGSDPGGDYANAWYHALDLHHPGAFASLSQRSTVVSGKPSAKGDKPADAQTRLADGSLDVIIGYCSGPPAQAGDATRKIPLPPPAPIADYALTITSRDDPRVLPLARFLLAPAAQTILREQGFVTLSNQEIQQARGSLCRETPTPGSC